MFWIYRDCKMGACSWKMNHSVSNGCTNYSADLPTFAIGGDEKLLMQTFLNVMRNAKSIWFQVTITSMCAGEEHGVWNSHARHSFSITKIVKQER
uniref:Uncharacterized protein n=1 Tax=Brassica oleracea TaxID=3712 RepID=A0A3P6DYZ7_BRAOL|nr:unnamed protein product [Brassica oleracea]VDD33062.1 unnamed protein product [Brassica oleracea]